MTRNQTRLAIALASLLLLSACNAARTVVPRSPAPLADSPQNAVRLLEYALNNRDVAAIASLLPEDATFETVATDSSGSLVHERWTRADLLLALSNLLVGSPTAPPAMRITTNFERTLVPFPDTRPGMTPEVHRTIRTSLDLMVVAGDGSEFNATGFALVYTTRGDSVRIPPEQTERGARPDAGRWWLSRWEDETLPSGGFGAKPMRSLTWGDLLRRYLGRTRV
jgi:hypothetical protein